MRSRRLPSPQPEDDWSPPPLPAGQLGPPRRRPPTAVGTATPEPPAPGPRPHPRSRYGSGVTGLQRVARTGAGALLAVSGGALAALAPLGLATAAGVGLLGAGVVAAYRAIRAPGLFVTRDKRPR